MDHWSNQRGNQKIPIWVFLVVVGKCNGLKPIGCSKSSFKWEVYNNTILSQEKKNLK